MALTLTELFRTALAGGGKMMCFDVTQDESTSTISAVSIDLTHIKTVLVGNQRLTSAAADTSTLSLMESVSITGNSDQLTIGMPADAGSKFTLWAIGW